MKQRGKGEGGLAARVKRKNEAIKEETKKKRKRIETNQNKSAKGKGKIPKTTSMKVVHERLGLVPGKLVVGRVDMEITSTIKVPPGVVLVSLAERVWGRLDITHIEDVEDWKDQPDKDLKHGRFLQCRILKPSSQNEEWIQLTTRPSILNCSDEESQVNALLEKESESSKTLPAVGHLVKGYVVGTGKAGCFVRITRETSGLVQLRHLSDNFVENVEKSFPKGKLVAGRVIHVDEIKGQVSLSLKSTSVVGPLADSNGHGQISFETIKVGDKLPGKVLRSEPYGVLVVLDNSFPRLVGLCHRTELEDDREIKDASSLYSKGDRVKVIVLSIDSEKRRLALGMKPSYFDDTDLDIDKDSGNDDGNEVNQENDNISSKQSRDDDDEDGKVVAKHRTSLPVLDPIEESEEEEEDDDDVEPEVEEDGKEGLSLQDLLKHDEFRNTQEPKDEDDGEHSQASEKEESTDVNASENTRKKRKLSSRMREKQRRREEAELRAKEESLLDEDRGPETAEDFERMLVGSPNSSMLWIQYIAFQIAQTEIDTARAIAVRALNTINFREEDEKQNVWTAYLNLEYKYGTPESLNEVFDRMVRQMNAKHAYYKLANVYKQGGDMENADQALKKAVKTSKGTSKGAWLKRIELKMDTNHADEARKLLQDAIRALPKRKHVRTMIQFARMEYSKGAGNVERARTVYEGLVDTYPKRTDIWHQYIDAELKFGNDPSRVRNLYERVVTIKTSAKKMKTFFKKWLTFENQHGTEENAESVKSRAREYVQRLAEA